MKTIMFGDQPVPAIGIGTWHMGDKSNRQADEIAAIQAGINAGARVIDTAEMYGNGNSERLVGKAIKKFNRQDLFIIDKVLPENASLAQLPKHLDASLKRVGTDYFDLYLYHWRGSVPLSETVEALQAAQATGKIKRWGVSNFDLIDMEELLAISGGKNVAANEDLYNLGSRGTEYDLQSWQVDHHIPFIAYTPVAQGDRFGQDLTTNSTILEIANRHDATPYQILLAWSIRNDNVLAIPQSSNPQHATENINSGDIELSAKELSIIDDNFPAPTTHAPLDIL